MVITRASLMLIVHDNFEAGELFRQLRQAESASLEDRDGGQGAVINVLKAAVELLTSQCNAVLQKDTAAWRRAFETAETLVPGGEGRMAVQVTLRGKVGPLVQAVNQNEATLRAALAAAAAAAARQLPLDPPSSTQGALPASVGQTETSSEPSVRLGDKVDFEAQDGQAVHQFNGGGSIASSVISGGTDASVITMMTTTAPPPAEGDPTVGSASVIPPDAEASAQSTADAFAGILRGLAEAVLPQESSANSQGGGGLFPTLVGDGMAVSAAPAGWGTMDFAAAPGGSASHHDAIFAGAFEYEDEVKDEEDEDEEWTDVRRGRKGGGGGAKMGKNKGAGMGTPSKGRGGRR